MATGIPGKKQSSNGVRDAYELAYPGKKSERAVLHAPPGKLAPVFSSGAEINQLIYGENGAVLRSLLLGKELRGQVKLVYIDPPYATGSRFESRTQHHAYNDHLGGAEYLEFLRERLILLRELLAEDGSIYVHLDEKMAFEAKLLMDEVFGRSNFRNWITRKKCNTKNYTRRTFGKISDFILFYSKSSEYKWNQQFEAWTVESAKEYSYVEEKTGRRFMKVPVHAPGIRNGATGGDWKGRRPPPGKHWQYTPDQLDAMDARGEIYWSPNGNPRRKIYFDESRGVPVQDIWLDFKDAHNQNIRITGYPTEKNADLLKRLVLASTGPGDIVLDAFGGSGTTAIVAAELGRRWVSIDNSLLAIATTIKRFAHGSERMGDFVNRSTREENLTLFSPSPLEGGITLSIQVDGDLDPIPQGAEIKWQAMLKGKAHHARKKTRRSKA